MFLVITYGKVKSLDAADLNIDRSPFNSKISYLTVFFNISKEYFYPYIIWNLSLKTWNWTWIRGTTFLSSGFNASTIVAKTFVRSRESDVHTVGKYITRKRVTIENEKNSLPWRITKGFLLATQQSGWHSNGYTTTKSVSAKEGVARTVQKSTIATDSTVT